MTESGPATWDSSRTLRAQTGYGWAEAMARRQALCDLADLVTRMAGDRLVTCHRDLHPATCLVEASGELAVLDWDDAGRPAPTVSCRAPDVLACP
jgi:thiamine kinase-like enzyme